MYFEISHCILCNGKVSCRDIFHRVLEQNKIACVIEIFQSSIITLTKLHIWCALLIFASESLTFYGLLQSSISDVLMD